ncbi:hypothetical protein P154DRAFT_527205 [Amniculicola lignicola CBS 123094]|uniref:Uncharacterized protein n=1 Tax=Amniculicola lignicola CBS 123094 TaxID=1392246 RepID=A0A6A5W251_9PLEO|nr:hypothetical protein P154DRAFT_527205 [Amniculicola lignicola CBS 123094]
MASPSSAALVGNLICCQIFYRDTIRAISAILPLSYLAENVEAGTCRALDILNDGRRTWPLMLVSDCDLARQLRVLLDAAKTYPKTDQRLITLAVYLHDPPEFYHDNLGCGRNGQICNTRIIDTFDNWGLEWTLGCTRDKKLIKKGTVDRFKKFIKDTADICKAFPYPGNPGGVPAGGEVVERADREAESPITDNVNDDDGVLVSRTGVSSVTDAAETVDLTLSRASSPAPTVHSIDSNATSKDHSVNGSKNAHRTGVRESRTVPNFTVTHQMTLQVGNESVVLSVGSGVEMVEELKVIEAAQELWTCLAENNLLGSAHLADVVKLARATVN